MYSPLFLHLMATFCLAASLVFAVIQIISWLFYIFSSNDSNRHFTCAYIYASLGFDIIGLILSHFSHP